MDGLGRHWLTGAAALVAVVVVVLLLATRYELKPSATGGVYRIDHWTGQTKMCEGDACDGPTAADTTQPPTPEPIRPPRALPPSKGANMVVCDPLPSASSVTPAKVDAVFLATPGRGTSNNGDDEMELVEHKCLTRQVYLLAAQVGDANAVAEAAFARCKDVITEVRTIETKYDVSSFDRHATPVGERAPPSEAEVVQRQVGEARVGKCWLQ